MRLFQSILSFFKRERAFAGAALEDAARSDYGMMTDGYTTHLQRCTYWNNGECSCGVSTRQRPEPEPEEIDDDCETLIELSPLPSPEQWKAALRTATRDPLKAMG